MKRRTTSPLLVWYINGFLLVALIVTNGFWFAKFWFLGIGTKALEDHARVECHALSTMSRILVEVAAGQKKEAVLEAARRAWPDVRQFEFDEYVQVNGVGLQFAGDGTLENVVRTNKSDLCSEGQ